MSILDLDTPPWLVITRHLHVVDMIAVANTHPRLRNHIRKLALIYLQQHFPNVYIATDPFPRLMSLRKYTQYRARLRYIPPEETVLECLELVYAGTRTYKFEYNDIDIDDGSIWMKDFTINGLPPPKGTVVYLLIYAPTSRKNTRVQMYITIDHAIEQYIADRYDDNCGEAISLYSDETYDIDHDDASMNINNPQVQEWMRDSGAPITPYTPDNIRAYMRKHLRAWLLDYNENDYVQIIPVTT